MESEWRQSDWWEGEMEQMSSSPWTDDKSVDDVEELINFYAQMDKYC